AVATFWMDLIMPFLARADIEIALFVDAIPHAARMILGFQPTPAQTLYSALSPAVSERENIQLFDPDWVTPDPDDYDLRKLASFLDQPSTTLRLTQHTFREVFLGQ